MSPRIHAVVLNYNSAAATLRAVSELKNSADVDVDVLVVDCASEPTDRALLEQRVGRERLLLLPENRGYAGGMNAGIAFWLERSPDTAILLVTPDAMLPPNAAALLLNELERDQKAGVVGPVVVYQEQPRKIAAGGAIDERGNVRPLTEITGNEPYDVDWLDGCCLLLRPAAIREVQFDEAYFLYYEETDLCLRMKQAGWHVRLVPSVSVLHPKSRSSAPPHYYYYMARNGYRFRARHFGVPTWRSALDLLRPAGLLTGIAVASLLLPNRWREARDRWRNCRLLWRGVVLGTRDHLRGSYGAQKAPTPRPG